MSGALSAKSIASSMNVATEMGMGAGGGFWSGRLLILGDSGSGKSVLTKQLVSGLCEKQLKDKMLGGMLGGRGGRGGKMLSRGIGRGTTQTQRT